MILHPSVHNDIVARRLRPQRTRGFSLVELLVVIAVIAILISLILPIIKDSREQAQLANCASNMRQVCGGIVGFSSDNDGYYPWAGGIKRNFPSDWVWGGQSNTQAGNPTAWEDPNFGFHPEGGAIFPYTVGEKRRFVKEGIDPIPGKGGTSGTQDNAFRKIQKVYTCTTTGDHGRALRVNFSLNNFIDSGLLDAAQYDPGNGAYIKDAIAPAAKGIRVSMVKNPVEKFLILNEDPRSMKNPSFHPGGTADDGADYQTHHRGRINVGYMDGHVTQVDHVWLRSIQRGLDNLHKYWLPRN